MSNGSLCAPILSHRLCSRRGTGTHRQARSSGWWSSPTSRYHSEIVSAAVYRKGNAWQRDRYAFMAAYLDRRGIRRFGVSRGGNAYRHLLTEDDAIHNFLGDESVLAAVRSRFASHKAGDLHRALTNTTASTPFCFNMFVPLQRDVALASWLVSTWLGKTVEVVHIEIEFTPNHCDAVLGFERQLDESLGDQSGSVGTDADVAIFYRYDAGKRGVVLVETKYIEDGFSICMSYADKPQIRSVCDGREFYDRLVAPHLLSQGLRPDCGYARYANWSLTAASNAIDGHAVATGPACPFSGSAQQLWRNVLLAERVAVARALDEFHFWVLSPHENTFLWEEAGHDVESRFRAVLTQLGDRAFRRLDLRRDFVEPISERVRGDQAAWILGLRDRYVATSPRTA